MSDATTPPALPGGAEAHLPEGVRLHNEGVAIGAQRDKFSPWDPRHQALGKQFAAIVDRKTAADDRAANAVPPPPERYHTVDAPAGGAAFEEGLARALKATQDEYSTVSSVLSGARMTPLDPAAEMKTLQQAWGANMDRNLAIVRAEVKRLGPDAAAWLEENGIADSAMVAHVILSAARRNGRAPW